MFILDETSDEEYYIVRFQNGDELCKIKKSINSLEQIKKQFEIKEDLKNEK